eukprot:2085-Heterococcus_DN1.PRE.1
MTELVLPQTLEKIWGAKARRAQHLFQTYERTFECMPSGWEHWAISNSALLLEKSRRFTMRDRLVTNLTPEELGPDGFHVRQYDENGQLHHTVSYALLTVPARIAVQRCGGVCAVQTSPGYHFGGAANLTANCLHTCIIVMRLLTYSRSGAKGIDSLPSSCTSTAQMTAAVQTYLLCLPS